MNLQRNYYEVLGLPPGATSIEIKTKYRELAKKFHPDLTQDKVLGQRIFAQINQAYRVLGDPDRRSQYDATLTPDRPQSVMSSSVSQSSAAQPGSFADAPQAPPPAQQTYGSQAAAQAAASPQMSSEIERLLGEADMAMMGGKIKEARVICETVLGMQPENVKATGVLGDVFAQLGETAKAIQLYRKALRLGSSPMIQAKLSRLMEAQTPSTPPADSSSSGASAPKNVPPPAKSGGGLFGRLLGRN